MGIFASAYNYKCGKDEDSESPTNDTHLITIDKKTNSSKQRSKFNLPKGNAKILTVDDIQEANNFESTLIVPSTTKRVAWGSFEKRTLVMDNDLVVSYYDGIINPEDRIGETEDYDAREISFENSENFFLIEDNYYRIHYTLPKKIDEIAWLSELLYEELITTKEKIETAIKLAKDSTKSNLFNRIDGMLLKRPSKQFILLTEFFVFDFTLNKNNNYELIRTIDISTIDYITIGRSGNFLTLHLVPVYKNKENINKSYTLQYYKLEKVVSCLTSSCFYDKYEGSTQKIETINRHIPVITVNDAFDVIENLQKIVKFSDYRNSLNDYLEKKVTDVLGYNIGQFKYASIKYRIKENKEHKKNKAGFLCADMILSSKMLCILTFNKSNKCFEVIYKININDLMRLTENKYVANCFTIFDSETVPKGLEIISESKMPLMNLIDVLYQQTLKNGGKK